MLGEVPIPGRLPADLRKGADYSPALTILSAGWGVLVIPGIRVSTFPKKGSPLEAGRLLMASDLRPYGR
jgi:hypothetical protein